MNKLKNFFKAPKKVGTLILFVLIILFILMGGTQNILDFINNANSPEVAAELDEFYKFHISIVDCFIGAGIVVAYIVFKIRQKLKERRRTKK